MLFFVIDEHRTNSPPPPPDLDSKLSFGVRVSCAFTWNFHFTLDDEWRIASCKCTIWYAPEKLKVFTLAYDWWMDGICFLGIRFCCIWFFWYDFCELIVINKGWNSFTFNAITFNFRLLQDDFFFSRFRTYNSVRLETQLSFLVVMQKMNKNKTFITSNRVSLVAPPDRKENAENCFGFRSENVLFLDHRTMPAINNHILIVVSMHSLRAFCR